MCIWIDLLDFFPIIYHFLTFFFFHLIVLTLVDDTVLNKCFSFMDLAVSGAVYIFTPVSMNYIITFHYVS